MSPRRCACGCSAVLLAPGALVLWDPRARGTDPLLATVREWAPQDHWAVPVSFEASEGRGRQDRHAMVCRRDLTELLGPGDPLLKTSFDRLLAPSLGLDAFKQWQERDGY